jgi:ABC-type nitrate/sulfonate/bicarbonate transport system substrate-binding protein
VEGESSGPPRFGAASALDVPDKRAVREVIAEYNKVTAKCNDHPRERARNLSGSKPRLDDDRQRRRCERSEATRSQLPGETVLAIR